MRVLVACEYSGRVRDAFLDRGHDAWSCDLLPTESPRGFHWQGDIKDILYDGWDLLIAHPPCTFLASSGSRWLYHPDDKHLPVEGRRPHPLYPDRKKDRQDAIDFFMMLWNAPIPHIAVENPVGVMSSVLRKPDQIVHPWQFGEEVSKATCLWLKNLPKLKPTKIVGKGEIVTLSSGKKIPAWYSNAPSGTKEERQKARSRTFKGMAEAMAEQWSNLENTY